MKLYTNIIALTFTVFTLMSCQSKMAPNQEQLQQQSAENVLPDFKMSHIGGGTISVKEEITKHKITIVDFWASWCSPCMQEVPSMVDLYNKYKNKGLGIIGISLDKDEQTWKSTVESMHMNWTHVSDLQGWNNIAAQALGVNSIPFIIIVDNKGTILIAGLRGEEVGAFVTSRLN